MVFLWVVSEIMMLYLKTNRLTLHHIFIKPIKDNEFLFKLGYGMMKIINSYSILLMMKIHYK